GANIAARRRKGPAAARKRHACRVGQPDRVALAGTPCTGRMVATRLYARTHRRWPRARGTTGRRQMTQLMGFDSPEVRDAFDADMLAHIRVVTALACAGYALAARDGWPLMIVPTDETRNCYDDDCT